MVLSDTGFWYAFFNPKDRFHQQAVIAMKMLDEGLITTWPVITETCYLLGKALGVQSQLRFIKALEADYIEVFEIKFQHFQNLLLPNL